MQQDSLPAWRLWLRRALRHRSFVTGGAIVLLLVIIAVFPQLFGQHDPLVGDLQNARHLPPSADYWLGTDSLGRDQFTRLIYGARISLQVGVLTVSLALLIGTVLGLLAGYLGGWLDETIMRGIDLMQAFPAILLAILIVAILGPSLTNAMIAIGLVNVPVYARLVRASALSLRNQEFIEASIAMGGRTGRILFGHILPNCLSPILVAATLGIGSAVLETAGLSFLGLGAQPPTPEWGAMLANARHYMQTAPWTVMFPGMAIMLSVLGFNLLGDGFRDLLDPRTAKQ